MKLIFIQFGKKLASSAFWLARSGCWLAGWLAGEKWLAGWLLFIQFGYGECSRVMASNKFASDDFPACLSSRPKFASRVMACNGE